MESVRCIPECVEPQDLAGEALRHRGDVLAQFAHSMDLGPVDLVWSRKKADGAFGEQFRTYFHHVVGLDFTSTASAGAYFADMSRLEKVDLVSGLFTSQEWSVVECVYCCFDVYSRLDIRCHMKSPGGIVAYALNNEGRRAPVSDLMWKQVAASALLRYEHYSPTMFGSLPALARYTAIADPDAEELILDAVLDLYQNKVPMQVPECHALDPAGGCCPDDGDPLLAALLQHFQRHAAWESAAEFYTQLARLHCPAVVQLCVCLDRLGRTKDSLQVLRSNALRAPDNSEILQALALKESLIPGQATDALMLARRALVLAPSSRSAYLTTARVFASCGQYALALLALSLTPLPEEPETFAEAIFPLGVAPHDRVTRPAEPLVDVDLEEDRRLISEFDWPTRVLPDKLSMLRNVMLSGSHFDASRLKTSVTRLRPYMVATAYDILLCVISAIGWDRMSGMYVALFHEQQQQEAARAERRHWSETTRVRQSGAAGAGSPCHRRSRRPRSEVNKAADRPRTAQTATLRGRPVRQELQKDAARAQPEQQPALLDEAGDDDDAGAPTAAASVVAAALPSPAYNPDLWSAVFGPAAADARSPPSAASPPPTADMSHVPAELMLSTRLHRRHTDIEGHPVAELASGVESPKTSGTCTVAQHTSRHGEFATNSLEHGARARCKQAEAACFQPTRCRRSSRRRLSTGYGAHPPCNPTSDALTALSGLDRRKSPPHPFARAPHDLSANSYVAPYRDFFTRVPVPQDRRVADAAAACDPVRWKADARSALLRHHASCRYAVAEAAKTAGVAPMQRGASTSRVVSQDALMQRLRTVLHSFARGRPVEPRSRLARLQVRAQQLIARSDVCPSIELRKLAARARARSPLSSTAAAAAACEQQSHKGVASVGAQSVHGVASSIVTEQQLEDEAAHLVDAIRARPPDRSIVDSVMCMASILTLSSGQLRSKHVTPALWLDELMQAVCEDARVFFDWRRCDVASLEASGKAVEETQLGVADVLPEASRAGWTSIDNLSEAVHTVKEGLAIESMTAGDWLLLAGTCERLHCTDDAKRAYRAAAAASDSTVCLSAQFGLARMQCLCGDVLGVFESLTDVLMAMQRPRSGAMATASTGWSARLSVRLVALVSELIDTVGMTTIQSLLEEHPGHFHPSLEYVTELAFEWGTDGCDA